MDKIYHLVGPFKREKDRLEKKDYNGTITYEEQIKLIEFNVMECKAYLKDSSTNKRGIETWLNLIAKFQKEQEKIV